MDTIWFEVGGIVVAFIAGVIFWLYTKGKQSCGKIFPDLFGSSNTSFWSTHTKIHETLTELRVRTDSARAQVVQFHNSGNFFEQTPIEQRFPNVRKATTTERSQLSNLTGGLLGGF